MEKISIFGGDMSQVRAILKVWPRESGRPVPEVVDERNVGVDSKDPPNLILFCCKGIDEKTVARCREIHLRHPLAGLFLLTASACEPRDLVRALDAGADDCLPRPVSPEEFRARLEAWARRFHGFRSPGLDEEHVVAALDVMNDAFFILDSNWRFSYVNQEAERLLRRKRSELIGRNVWKEFPEAVGTESYCEYHKAFETGQGVHFEQYFPPLDTLFEVEAHRSPAGLAVTFRDITERNKAERRIRDSEQRHRLLFNSNPQPVFIYDLETLRFLAVNRASVEAYGYSYEEFLGMTLKDITPDEEVADLISNIESVKSRKVPEIDHAGVWQHRLRDGTIICVEITSHPLEFKGRPAELVLAYNVTGRVRAEREIANLNAELEDRVAERTDQLKAINEELEAFSYSVSHDLRAPLRAIDGFTRALEEAAGRDLDDMAHHYLQRILGATERMSQLIDDLLELSRISRMEIRKSRVDLSAMAGEIVVALKQSDPQREVFTAVAPGVFASGDPRLLRIMLENLLNNAWKFTMTNALPRIEFGVERTGDGSVGCCVRDNGVGFDMRYAHKLFGPFQRLHSMAEFPGTGIGLATVKRIIQLHGGRVWAEAIPGEGAAFYFTLE